MAGDNLEINSPPEKQFAALEQSANRANSDLTQLICRDNKGKLLSVAVHARGEYAKALLKFLQSKRFVRL